MTKGVREALVMSVAAEFAEADLGDPRRDLRLLRASMLAAAKPSASFPKIARSQAELEGIYRLMSNEHVDLQDILAPHVDKTVERARKAGVVLALHDTTQAAFKGEKRAEALGAVGNGASGFFVHATLAVSAEGDRTPLGVLGLRPFAREPQPKRRKKKHRNQKARRSKAVMRSRKKAQVDKESDRWRVAALETQELIGSGTKCIHMMDREGDSYPLLASLHEATCRYVVRAKHDRRLEEGLKLWAALEEITGEVFREVTLSRRRFINRAFAHPQRSGRSATLHIRSRQITLPRPEGAQSEVPELTLWVVQVYEPDPPPGEPAVEWTLLTSEPIRTLEDATRVVDWYRTRWVIEEYFKCLKTGCALEERQLESEHSLLNALALFAPIAWTLLALRTAAKQNPDAPASAIFSADQQKLLRAICVRSKLPSTPTIRDALLAIAGLGGHIKNNGDPGWATLADGYREFLAAERGWLAATHANL
jgi:hypothetical protein